MTIEYILFSLIIGHVFINNIYKNQENKRWVKFYYHIINLFFLWSSHHIWWAVVGSIK